VEEGGDQRIGEHGRDPVVDQRLEARPAGEGEREQERHPGQRRREEDRDDEPLAEEAAAPAPPRPQHLRRQHERQRPEPERPAEQHVGGEPEAEDERQRRRRRVSRDRCGHDAEQQVGERRPRRLVPDRHERQVEREEREEHDERPAEERGRRGHWAAPAAASGPPVSSPDGPSSCPDLRPGRDQGADEAAGIGHRLRRPRADHPDEVQPPEVGGEPDPLPPVGRGDELADQDLGREEPAVARRDDPVAGPHAVGLLEEVEHRQRPVVARQDRALARGLDDHRHPARGVGEKQDARRALAGPRDPPDEPEAVDGHRAVLDAVVTADVDEGGAAEGPP
jgi:hypothetical protein